MGDTWRLLLGERAIRYGKNSTPAKLMTVFRERDKYMHADWARLTDEYNACAQDYSLPEDQAETRWNAASDQFESWEDAFDRVEGVSPQERFGYRATVQTVVTRLELMGFKAQECRSSLIDELTALRDDELQAGRLLLVGPPRGGRGGPQAEYWLTPEEIIDTAVRSYYRRSTKPFWASKASDPKPQLTELETLCVAQFDFFLDDTDFDPRTFLALILRGRTRRSILRLDLSDLLAAGYYFSRDEPVAAEALQQLRDETASSGPIIVITEGKFDSRVLERALRIVRPDVADYFTFWDLEETKAPGGTDRVPKNLRSFAAAGVMNRVIAIVDNDVAGLKALKTLENPPLPSLYQARSLPDLDFAHSYPTIGQSGLTRADVNGQACSVEFYFGLDCLTGQDGTLVPVKLLSYDQKLDRWQGALQDKTAVQKRIEQMLDDGESGATELDERWDSLRAVAQVLIDAAHGQRTPSMRS